MITIFDIALFMSQLKPFFLLSKEIFSAKLLLNI